MSLTLPKTCAMGSSQTGLAGTIGVTLLNADGTVHTARDTADIYEIGGGCYGKSFAFPDNWAGVLKWDTGGGSPVYACEEYTVDGLVDKVLQVTEIKRAKVSDLSATTLKFITDLTEVTNNFWDRGVILFSGQNEGLIRAIKNYNGGTKEIQIQTPLSFAPANGDDFIIVPARKFLTPDVLELADAVWDEPLTGASHNIATSAGKRLRQSADVLISREETCQAGGANDAIILDAGASAVDDFYINDIIILESGAGVGQSRHVDSYDGGTKTATVNRDWTTNPDATTNYVIRFDSTKHVHGFEQEAKNQINAECDTALTDYDAPTKTEMDNAFTEIKGATWDAGTDTLEDIMNGVIVNGNDINTSLAFTIMAGGLCYELYLLQGLDTTYPMTVTPTSRKVETIEQTITGDGKTLSTVTRTA